MRRVFALTLAFMVVEIVAGFMTHSMALLADGWHMGTHAAGYGVALLAYALAERFAREPRRAALFTWGTWKIEVLGSFISSLILFGVAIAMAIEAVIRLVQPQPIVFDAAIVVAVAGLAVNILEMLWLRGGASSHHHAHADDPTGHTHRHDHDPHAHGDLNLRAAYVHAATDALTSITAIVALLSGRFLGWVGLDPIAAIVGSALVIAWGWRVAQASARILLDAEADAHVVHEVRDALEDADTQVRDLHVWRVGRARYCVAVSIVARDPRLLQHYRDRLGAHDDIVHATIEIEPAALT